VVGRGKAEGEEHLINCQKCQKTSCAKQVAKQKLTVLTCTAYKAKKTNMKTCPNCGKVEGGHSSILQGCVCQYSMQAPPQRTWQGLTDEDISEIVRGTHNTGSFVRAIESKLKQKNGFGEENT
jgi:hypothetical protein